MSRHRPCVHCAPVRLAQLAFIRATFVSRGTAEWPARVDRVRWTLTIGDWRFAHFSFPMETFLRKSRLFRSFPREPTNRPQSWQNSQWAAQGPPNYHLLVGRFARIDSRFGNPFFCESTFQKWIAARFGRESREFECESERRCDSRESGKCFKTGFFSQIDSRESAKHWCANRLPTKYHPFQKHYTHELWFSSYLG